MGTWPKHLRLVMVGVLALLVGAACAPRAPGDREAPGAQVATEPAEEEAGLTPLKLGIGVHAGPPWHRLIAFYDEKFGVVKETGAEYGYDFDVEWLVVPNAPDVFSGMHAGDIHIGASATFPLLTQWGQGVDFLPLDLNSLDWRFILVVNPQSPIKDFEDLKGKTIGAVLGTQLQAVVDSFLQSEFGATAQELGIKYVNQRPAIDRIPAGMDAVSSSFPTALAQLNRGTLVPFIWFSGVEGGAMTGVAYDGPLGKGEGHQIPSVKKSPFFPDGYVANRIFFLVFPEFVDQHPKAVEAFVVAHQRIIEELAAMSLNELGDLYPENFWEDVPREQYQEGGMGIDLLYHRGWVWPTEREVQILETESEFLVKTGALEQPFDRATILEKWQKTAPILERAYEAVGIPSDPSDFTQSTPEDTRGQPIWELTK